MLAGSTNTGPDQRALLFGALKLIEFPRGEHPDELYDLAADPGEHRNLAAGRPDLVRESSKRLEEYWSELGTVDSSVPVELTPEVEEQLRALGYL